MNSLRTLGPLRCGVMEFRPAGQSAIPTLSSSVPCILVLACFGFPLHAHAVATNIVAMPTPLPDLGFSVLRLIGALVFVIALFLVAIWGIRRWQQTRSVRCGGPRLVVMDVKSLGGRQSIYVVGYERQRMLIGTSTAGVSLIAHLPEGDSDEAGPSGPASFAAAFQQVLGRKTP